MYMFIHVYTHACKHMCTYNTCALWNDDIYVYIYVHKNVWKYRYTYMYIRVHIYINTTLVYFYM